jgi:osmotically-inducible protein OsmY
VENLQAQAEEALAAKGLDYIQVLSEHALIMLRGEVPDTATRYQAEDIVKRIPGVRGVVNETVVREKVTS